MGFSVVAHLSTCIRERELNEDNIIFNLRGAIVTDPENAEGQEPGKSREFVEKMVDDNLKAHEVDLDGGIELFTSVGWTEGVIALLERSEKSSEEKRKLLAVAYDQLAEKYGEGPGRGPHGELIPRIGSQYRKIAEILRS